MGYKWTAAQRKAASDRMKRIKSGASAISSDIHAVAKGQNESLLEANLRSELIAARERVVKLRSELLEAEMAERALMAAVEVFDHQHKQAAAS